MDFRQPFTGSYPITQSYGDTVTSAFHTGIDYGCPEGTPILASEAGYVVFAGWDKTGYGNCVIIWHKPGVSTLYAHLSRIVVSVGEQVARSEIIGYSGNTGNSTGAHLHFEARTDPADYRTHFDPVKLPLKSSIEPAVGADLPEPAKLKDASALGSDVEIVAPSGAWGWNADFSKRVTVFPDGTKLAFTGRTAEHLGYQYCEVYPEPVKYYVAVNDHVTQILDNVKE